MADFTQDHKGDEGRIARGLRRFMLAIVAFAMTGTFFDLMMFRHYQDAWQMIPLGLFGLAAMTLIWLVVQTSTISVRAFQTAMLLLVAAGVAGVIFHMQAIAGFQGELDPSTGRWQLLWTVLHSKVPPTLAPAGLMQMGLLGLAATYRHPATRRRVDPS